MIRVRCYWPFCPWWAKYTVRVDGIEKQSCAKHLSQAVRAELIDHDNVVVRTAA